MPSIAFYSIKLWFKFALFKEIAKAKPLSLAVILLEFHRYLSQSHVIFKSYKRTSYDDNEYLPSPSSVGH